MVPFATVVEAAFVVPFAVAPKFATVVEAAFVVPFAVAPKFATVVEAAFVVPFAVEPKFATVVEAAFVVPFAVALTFATVVVTAVLGVCIMSMFVEPPEPAADVATVTFTIGEVPTDAWLEIFAITLPAVVCVSVALPPFVVCTADSRGIGCLELEGTSGDLSYST